MEWVILLLLLLLAIHEERKGRKNERRPEKFRRADNWRNSAPAGGSRIERAPRQNLPQPTLRGLNRTVELPPQSPSANDHQQEDGKAA
jgi:hypothetical protein